MKTIFIYHPKQIEAKWQKFWEKNRVYQPDLQDAKKPYYNLMMFPYPSAEGLHVGNMYAFTGADVHGRFKRMQGYDVFEPIGLDGFGIHSENYAIKVGQHPIEHAKVSEKHFYEQLHMIGNGFSWDQKLETYDPEYYRWTQWLFVQMYKNGLAYRKKAMVNWCPSCKTVLSDEQVEGGVCERCKTPTTRKETEQWFFKITAYADQLLENLDKIDWPKKIKVTQRNWIGKTEGLNIDFVLEGGSLKNANEVITVWTKYWETVFGTTFLVVAPEHNIVEELSWRAERSRAFKSRREFENKISQALVKTEQQRKEEIEEKHGFFTGSYAINPINGERVPIWIGEYVLMDVGTGAVMGVPAHDGRDFEFAKKHDLSNIQVISYADNGIDQKVKNAEMAYEGEGKLVNSGQFNDLDAWGEGKEKMAEWMIGKGFARWQTTYHLRDWLISRQRYWGPPIPMVFCAECAKNQGPRDKGQRLSNQKKDLSSLSPQPLAFSPIKGWFPVPEDQLPVLLPYVKDFRPIGEGKAPLEKAPEEWLETTCPNCGGKATRSTEVSDTFLDSSWYFLKYPSATKTQNSKLKTELPWDLEITKKWLPVNVYIGGAEHAVLHLLYSRFMWMVLKDWGYLPDIESEEPFPFLFSHGLIIKYGVKMSKSRGNIVSPDEYVNRFGADALRMYLMFLGPYDQGGDFRDTGMAGMYKFLERIWNSFQKRLATDNQQLTTPELKSFLHRTIKQVTNDLEKFKYNTSIAKMMEFMNAWEGKNRAKGRGSSTLRDSDPNGMRDEGKQINLSQKDAIAFLKLLAPFAPHISEELYHQLFPNAGDSIHQSSWPKADERFLQVTALSIPIQVNGKTRAVIPVSPADAHNQEKLVTMARANARVSTYLTGKPGIVFVPGKTINFVVS